MENIQKDLISLLIEKTKKRLFLTIRAHPDVKLGKCQIEVSEKEQILVENSSKIMGEKLEENASELKAKGEESASKKLMMEMNISNNDSLLRHVDQNNEIIARILRELDDKS